jgi:flagellar biosynthesis protein FlhG
MNNDQAADLRNKIDAEKVEEINKEVLPISRLRPIAIGSGKGGVGKTFVSVNLGFALAKKGQRVLIVDADLGLANVDIQMGITPKFTLQDVLFGNCKIEQAVHSTINGPDIIAASSGAPEMVDIGGARREMLADELLTFAARYDFLLIDVGAGIGDAVTTFLSAAPEVLIVVANEPTSIMDAYALIKVLSQQKQEQAIQLVVNMVHDIEEGEELAKRLTTITKKFLKVNVSFVGIITYDPLVATSIRFQKPLLSFSDKSGPAHCINELAENIMAKRNRKEAQLSMFEKLAEMALLPAEEKPK